MCKVLKLIIESIKISFGFIWGVFFMLFLNIVLFMIGNLEVVREEVGYSYK